MFCDNRKTVLCALLMASALSASGCGGGTTSPPAGTGITVSFPGVAPAAVAEQIGTGAWTATSLQDKQLTVTLPEGETRYAVAYVCAPNGVVNSEFVAQATTQDSAPPIALCSPGLPPTGSVTGSVDASAIPGTSSVSISGPRGGGLVSGVKGAFKFPAEKGTDDIAVVAADASLRILAVKIVRSQAVPGTVNGGNAVVLTA